MLDQLGLVDVFLPNAAEAMSYTRQHDVESAASCLAGYGPLVVVKRGAAGALAAGDGLDEPAAESGIPTEALDTTGAGDVFDAGFIYATLAAWPIGRRLRFANLCAGESVSFAGDSLSAPCWRDLRAWWEREQDDAMRRAYDFLPGLLEACRSVRTCERPRPSLGVPGSLERAPSPAK
jgi:sugar/nucleoside kinase (ribokinase family)